MVYNVHSLVHLSNECEIHGPLDNFSAFPFESYLGKLKKLIRSPHKPLAQIVKQISELNNLSLNNSIMPSIFNTTTALPHVQTLKPNTKKDSFYLTDKGMVVKVVGCTHAHLTVKVFLNLRSFYGKPLKSKQIDIYKSTGLSRNLQVWNVKTCHLTAKCWVYPTDGGCCIVPFVHNM